VLLAAVFAAVAFPASAVGVPPTPLFGGNVPACYSNQFVYTDGAGSSVGAGSATSADSELEFPGQAEVNLGSITFGWAYTAIVSGPNTELQPSGNIRGFLSVRANLPGNNTLTFISSCIAEVGVENGLDKTMEMEAEGFVVGFPTFGAPQPAVLTLDVASEGGIAVDTAHISVELGSTCFEGATESDETELNVTSATDEGGTNSGLFTVHGDGQRWSFPDGFNPDNCPGAF